MADELKTSTDKPTDHLEEKPADKPDYLADKPTPVAFDTDPGAQQGDAAPINPVRTDRPLATEEQARQDQGFELDTARGKLASAYRAFSRLKRGGIEPGEIDAALADLQAVSAMIDHAVGNLHGYEVVRPSPMMPSGSPTPSPGSQSAAAQSSQQIAGAPAGTRISPSGAQIISPRRIESK